jgi:hypothetical protein
MRRNNKECKIISKVFWYIWARRGELSQEVNSLHMRGLVLPSGDSIDIVGVTFFGFILAARRVTLEFGEFLS